MRSCASALSFAGIAREAGGGPIASAAAAAIALTKWLTRRFVEEVHARDLDGDGQLIVDLQLDVRGELCNEVRPRRDDAFAAGYLLDLLLALLPLADHVRVDAEVDHRLAAERFDELDARVELRELRPL